MARILNKVILLKSFKKMRAYEHPNIDDTIILDESMVVEPNYQSVKKPVKEQGEFAMNESFINDQSMYVAQEEVTSVFQKTFSVPAFVANKLNLTKLKQILSEKYKVEVSNEKEEEVFSPPSEDVSFKVE